MARNISVSEGSTEQVINGAEARENAKRDDKEGYEFEVLSGRVRFGHSEQDARLSPRRFKEEDRGKFDPKAKAVYVHAIEGYGNATVAVEASGISFSLSPRFVVQVDELQTILQLQNGGTVNAFTHDPDVDGLQLPDTPVQDTDSLMVQADPANAGNGYVGNSGGQPVALEPGDAVSLSVDNANRVYVSVDNVGDVFNCMSVSN